MGRKITVAFLVLVFTFVNANSQCISHFMHYEGSKDPAIALKELLEKYELSPLEINSCAADELIDFPLLSPVQ